MFYTSLTYIGRADISKYVQSVSLIDINTDCRNFHFKPYSILNPFLAMICSCSRCNSHLERTKINKFVVYRKNGGKDFSRSNAEHGNTDSHNFLEYTYKKITPCDICSQVLRGKPVQVTC